MRRFFWLAMLWIASSLSACGGGSGGDSLGSPTGQLPGPTSGITVFAQVYSYPDGYPPTGGLLSWPNGYPPTPQFFAGPSAGANSTAWVEVRNYPTGTASIGATVVVNGVSLPFDSAKQAYVGDLTIATGATIDVSARVGSSVYTGSMNQVSSFHTVTSPLMASSVSAAAPLTVTWTLGDHQPWDYGYYFDLWAVDASTGSLVWSYPFTELGNGSFVIPAGELSLGNRMIVLLAAASSPIIGAVGRSGLFVGAVRAVSVIVSQ